MFIIIKDGYDINYLNLEKINYPYQYKSIEIINDNGYSIKLNNDYHFEDKTNYKLIELSRYKIIHNNPFEIIELFIYQNDEGFNDYYLYKNESFIFNENNKANIICKDNNLKGVYLYLKNKQIQTNYEYLLINDKPFKNEELKSGDKISLFSFIFFYYENFLYINNFLINNKLNKYHINEEIIHYDNNKILIKNHYLIKRKELEIAEIKTYNQINIPKQRKLIYQIGPSITMSLAMLSIASINVYNNYLNGNDILNSLVYILMPTTMLLSGVLWPIINNHSEKKENELLYLDNKNKYLEYLETYENDLKNKINAYLKQEYTYYFNGFIDEDKLFYITNKYDNFLNISIGTYTFKKEFNIKETNDKDINEKINQIIYRLLNIEKCPLFIDLKKYQAITFYLFDDKYYFINKLMIELAYKYSYDDFYLAIYDNDFNNMKYLLNCPQLIYGKMRLTLKSKREIQELDSLKLDKPLILFLLNKIDYKINNKNIKILYFTQDKKDIYKDSDLYIEYLNENGFINGDQKISFAYVKEELDYSKFNNIFHSINNIEINDLNYSFKNIFKDDVYNYYSNKQKGLRADFAYIGNEILNFDLHESKNGPHGLIGGSTGSGKSELIISLLLSLCIRYRPDYLNIILIDYKGGGIEESLSYHKKVIPHIIASITNLENNIFERLIISITFECKRRQILFKELSNKILKSIMNIDDYLENNDGLLPNISHLLIVVDEFAELKKENPFFIKELISLSRIGRSLGIHLILATQRPSGIIDEEIWSNSRFKIALKVLNEKDSNDIIKSKEAAYLNNPGEFYLAIDDHLNKAKAIYSKNDINMIDAYEVSTLDNRLRINDKYLKKDFKPLSETNYYVNKIIETTSLLNINNNKLAFKKPDSLSYDELKNKYTSNGLIIGEIDDYLNNKKDILNIPLDNHVFIYSSRRKEINIILNHLKEKMIVIGSKRYENEYISDSLLYEENEDLEYLFKKIINDNYKTYIIIEDIATLLSYDENINNYLYQIIRRKNLNNINIIALSMSSLINFKLINSFKYKYVIKINDSQDLLNIFTGHNEYKGDSFFYQDKIISFVPIKEEEFIEKKKRLNPYLKKIPTKVIMKKEDDKTLIGYSIKNRNELYIERNEKLIITSYDLNILNIFKKLYEDYDNIFVLNYNDALKKKDVYNYLWIKDGLYNQRLFFVDTKEILNKNEAYLYKGNVGEKVKIIDYE